MGESNRPKRVELQYCFDRLSGKKLAQAYRILVPDLSGSMSRDEEGAEAEEERVLDENRSDLHACLF